MRICLNMMLKNEGKTIREVITRVLPVIDGAVIGVDDKTNDNTLYQVDKAFSGSKIKPDVIKFTFKNNFAEIRNMLLDVSDNGDYDYVLVLDGHDLMTEISVEMLRRLKAGNDLKLDVYDVNVVQRKREGETWFQQPRIFKTHIRYSFAIHNTIVQTYSRATIPQIVIYHEQPVERYEARKQQRAQINVDGLLAEVDKNGKRAKFYVAQTLFEQMVFEEAAIWYQDYINNSTFVAERFQARLYLAKCYHELGRYEDEIKTLRSCFDDNEPRNEHLIALGDIYFERGDAAMALYYYRLAETVKMPTIFLIIEREYYTWLPNYKQLQVYLKLNDVANALAQCDAGEQKAPELTLWREIRNKITAKVNEFKLKRRGLIYFVASNVHFLQPVIDRLHERYSVRFENKFDPDHVGDADLIWCDWADYNAVAVARYQGKVKKILRVHSYEAYSSFVNSFDVNAFDKIVFVAKHTAHFLLNRLSLFGAPEVRDKIEIIPNGVDMSEFTIPKNKTANNNIAFAGNLKCGKGVQLLVMLANELREYNFYVAGTFQDLDLQEYYYKNIPGNVYTYAWQNDLNSFFADKTYVLSCSVRESNHLTVMQGMAAGLMPLVHNWVGADDLYPQQYLWKTITELRNLLETVRPDPTAHRVFISENYNALVSMKKIEAIVKEMVGA